MKLNNLEKIIIGAAAYHYIAKPVVKTLAESSYYSDIQKKQFNALSVEERRAIKRKEFRDRDIKFVQDQIKSIAVAPTIHGIFGGGFFLALLSSPLYKDTPAPIVTLAITVVIVAVTYNFQKDRIERIKKRVLEDDYDALIEREFIV